MTAQAVVRQPSLLFPTVDTPALLVDVDRLEANLTRMADHARQIGVDLRPHAKTHKSVEIARRQVALGAVGITVAKPQEALTFWRAGISPIFLAYPPVGDLKLAALRPMIADRALIVGLDDIGTAEPLGALATAEGVTLPVMVEVDTGMRRVGVPSGGAAAELALRVARIDGLELRGIFTHEGHAHNVATADLPTFAGDIAAHMHRTAGLIRAQGVTCPIISVGSSLTAWHMRPEFGVTEMRPGTYVFNDVRTVLDGGASWEDCAVTILSTVVSRPERGRAVIDAGAKILTPTHSESHGFGLILDIPGARLVRLNEEHGIMELGDPSVDLRVGDRVRIIPIHVCVTVNMQRELVAVQDQVALGTITVDAALCSR